jgi:hypothetical protein
VRRDTCGTLCPVADEHLSVKKDLIIAEYNAVRTAASQKATAAQASAAAYFTLVAALVGFIASAKADVRLLLVVPVLSAAFGITIASRYISRQVAFDYIHDVLRPMAADLVTDPRVLGWDDHYAAAKKRNTRLHQFGLNSLLPIFSVVALVVTLPKLSSAAEVAAWLFGLACLGGLAVVRAKAGHTSGRLVAPAAHIRRWWTDRRRASR